MYIKFKHTKNESVYEKSEEQLPLGMGRTVGHKRSFLICWLNKVFSLRKYMKLESLECIFLFTYFIFIKSKNMYLYIPTLEGKHITQILKEKHL